MGNYISFQVPRTLRKRAISQELTEKEFQERMHAPKRKKLTSTAQFIYKNLFVDGNSSDITILALGQEWKLHRLYLSQSPYFSSMFYGGWKESDQSVISLQVFDKNINAEALSTVLGSLYLDEVVIKPINSIPILAAAVMFQLENLISQCCSVMQETTNISTVVKYYKASEEYNMQDLRQFTKEWLLFNLTTAMCTAPQHLRCIGILLMADLIASVDLYVVQTEFCLYRMLKCWLFLCENSSWDGENFDECLLQADKFFHEDLLEDEYFLETDSGEPYKKVFSCLRLKHLLNDISDIDTIEKDRIIPSSWFQPVYRDFCRSLLKTTNRNDLPLSDITDEAFHAECMRCGRIITADQKHVWRWTGYNFNSNIIMTYNSTSRLLYMERKECSFDSLPFNVARSLESRYAREKFLIQVIITSYEPSQLQLTYKKTSPIKIINFNAAGRYDLIKIKKASFPLIVIAKFLFHD